MKKFCVGLSVLFFATSFVFAGDANACTHYRGATATMTQGTDTGPLSSLFYGEACGFKFNVELTVYNSPWHTGPSYPTDAYGRKISDTERVEYEIYMQTVEGNAGDLTYPYGTNVVEYQVAWHYEQYGYVPALCAYQGGQYSYANYIHDYILAGRNSAFDFGYEYGLTDKLNTKYYKNSTRHGDDPATNALEVALGTLDNAIANNGWYRDFMHWHTNPAYDVTLYQLLEGMQERASSNRLAAVSTGKAIQHRWLRDNSTVSLSTNGSSLEVSATYNMPSWMYVEWTGLNITNVNHLRPVDGFCIPLSVKVDLSGTILSGNDIAASGAASIRKLGTDDFVVEVPFNRTNEIVTVSLSATNSPDYANEALPFVESISNTGTNWQVITDQKTRMVIFTFPVGQSLADIHAKDGTDPAKRVDSPENLRFNTFLTTHSFSVPVSTNRDYYVGLITEEKQSILVPLTEMSGEDPVITLNGDNPMHVFVGEAYVEPGATAMDNIDGDITSNIVIDASSVNTSATGTYYVTYNVTDSDSNAAVEVVRHVDVTDDTTPPVITLIGDTILYLTEGDTYVEYGATALDDKDGDVSSNIVIDASSVNTSVAGTYYVTYNVSDAASNAAVEVSRTVEVAAGLVSKLTFLAHFNDTNSFDINSANGDSADGDSSATVTGGSEWGSGYFTNSAVSVPANMAFHFTNTSTVAFDAFGGNVDYKSYTDGGITVGFWCKDVNNAYISSTFIQLGVGTSGDYLVIEYGYGTSGKLRIRYYEDGAYSGVELPSSLAYIGNWVYFAVTVDLTASELKVYQFDNSGNLISSPSTLSIPGAAWDIKDDVNSLVKVGGAVSAGTQCTIDELSIDNYVLTQSNIQERVNQMVGGAELSTGPASPIIQLVGANPQILAVGDIYVELGATAYDPEDGDISSNIVIDASSVNTSATGTYYVTYNVTDSGSNAAPEVIRTVNVRTDITPPVITLNGDNPLALTVGDTYVEPGATASDNIDGDISSNIVIDASDVDTSVAGTYGVTYNVSDAAGNAANEVVRSVVVSKSTADGFSFLAHFNDTSSWDINPANGDYAAGSKVATIVGAPVWGSGFFPGSKPENKAFYANSSTHKVRYAGNDGNVPISDPVGDAMTVGFWIKITGNQKLRPIIIRNSNYSDYLMFDYGQNIANKWTMIFNDGGSQYKTLNFDASAYIGNWMYFATTLNLASETLKSYQYDKNGNLISAIANVINVTSWNVTNGTSLIEFNYAQSGANELWIDDFSIDNYELTQAELQARVDKMVAGTGMFMVIR